MKINKTFFLDCTLRDGSYNNNFSFSPKQTFEFIKKIQNLNFKYIEVGHGLGLNAYMNKNVKSKFSDISIMRKTSNFKNIGFFMQTNVATLENILECKKYNVSFIRIGSNPDKIKSQYKFIDQCIKNKIKPISFIMKSHLLKPKKFAIKCKNLYEQGAKLIYLVDSIGCLRPENINNFYHEVKYLEPKIKLGFHGHDNLGLATANSLEAFKLNFDFIDMTLQGVGRSGGNLSTEKFLSIISQKNNIPTNFKKLFQFSSEFIKKTKCENKTDIFDIICGYKKIHSGDIIKISGNLNQTKKINKLLQLNYKKRKLLNIY